MRRLLRTELREVGYCEILPGQNIRAQYHSAHSDDPPSKTIPTDIIAARKATLKMALRGPNKMHCELHKEKKNSLSRQQYLFFRFNPLSEMLLLENITNSSHSLFLKVQLNVPLSLQV